jgi:3-hydroxybutyrate dehydrogenase
MRLNDNLAIVTRAGSGIGKEIAIIYGRQGAKVTVADLNQKATRRWSGDRSSGKRFIGAPMDAADEQQVAAPLKRS